MPYFVKVGYEKKNVHSVTSKGYYIYRSGKKVVILYGAIEISGLRNKRFTWCKEMWPYEEVYSFRSIQKAEQFKKERIRIRIRHGYNKLPSSSIIYKRKIK